MSQVSTLPRGGGQSGVPWQGAGKTPRRFYPAGSVSLAYNDPMEES